MIVAGIGTIIILISLFVTLIIRNQKRKHYQEENIATIPPLSFHQLIQNMTWTDVEKEMIRLSLDKKRELSQMKLAYGVLLKLEPANYLEKKNYELHLYINEKSSFIDVCTKEDGDPYTEYMIDHEEWHNILAYYISSKSLLQYEKPTLVSAILYSMTTNGFSLEELHQSIEAHTG
ncbi:DUF6557 family protein [Shimazuella alba]|uniref:Uncharacterized protein n=1 Tax=Shimazuella alba TaxID=2690964 RepID=A0A6I4VUS4_9BACL|nr:DUF6557 family protein [Shimazuella alba]MXQ55589.1 hypothetical protein [Shimazuella alba]